MSTVCLKFQVHQPCLLKHYTVFDIGRHHLYEDPGKNREVLDQLAEYGYLPANRIFLQLIEQYQGDFRLAFAISGTTLRLFEKYRGDVLEGFQQMAGTGCVEFLNDTDPHLLAFLFSPVEFREQIELHKKKILELFGQNATALCCSIYNNELARIVEGMGYSILLTEGKEGLPGFQRGNFVYSPANCQKMKLILRNSRLSDDIQFSFAETGQESYGLSAGQFVSNMVGVCGKDRGQVVNLFLDYGIFTGRKENAGIFEFLQALPGEVLRQPDFHFDTPAETAKRYDPAALLDVPDSVFRSDKSRDLTAWMGNAMQRDALRALYDLEEAVRNRKDADCLAVWRMLQTSDYFSCMCTEGAADGLKQRSSNPYASPYEAYINYMNILDDFARTLQS